MPDPISQEQIMVSNGPLLPGSIVVLTECHAQGAGALSGRFLGGDPRWRENLELLGRGEAVALAGDDPVGVSWTNRQTELPRSAGELA